MDSPIDKVGGAAEINAAQAVSAAATSGAAGSQQLAQLMRVLVEDVAGYASPDQVATMLSSLRQLADAGVPLRDVADAMYASPLALDAMRDGDSARAAQSIAAWMGENVNELKDAGVPEDRLRLLSQQGFAVGEIALAMRVVPGLREELLRGDFSNPRQFAQILHDYLRDAGRGTHRNPALLLADHLPGGLNSPSAVWTEQYLQLVRQLRRRFGRAAFDDQVQLRRAHPDEEDEVNLLVPPPAPPMEQPSAHFGAWVVAVIVAVSLFVLILERC